MNRNTNRSQRIAVQLPAAPASGAVNIGAVERSLAHDLIARRAYAIYESRHRADGHAEEDWLQAEAENATHEVAPEGSSRRGASSSFADRVRDGRR